MIDNQGTRTVLVRPPSLLGRRLELTRLHGTCRRLARALQRQNPVAARLSPPPWLQLVSGVAWHTAPLQRLVRGTRLTPLRFTHGTGMNSGERIGSVRAVF